MTFRSGARYLALAGIAAAAMSGSVLAQDGGITADTPEATIAAAFPAGESPAYVGDCAVASGVEDSGSLCSTFAIARDSDGMSAYMVAAARELTGTWFFLTPADGGWRLVSTEHALCLDDPNSPPFPQ